MRILVLSFLLLNSCALVKSLTNGPPPSKAEPGLDAWVGKTEDSLVRKWGPPSSVYQNETQKILTYTKEGPEKSRYNSFTKTVKTKRYSCSTSFYFKNGVVDTWRSEGNSC